MNPPIKSCNFDFFIVMVRIRVKGVFVEGFLTNISIGLPTSCFIIILKTNGRENL